jgi:hypothetical protein
VVAITGVWCCACLHSQSIAGVLLFVSSLTLQAPPIQLENEVRDETWFVASVSKEILFKSRDRMGTRRAKPLW